MISFVEVRRDASAGFLPMAFDCVARASAPLAGALLIAASAVAGAQPLSGASAPAATASAAPATAAPLTTSRNAALLPSAASPAWVALTPAQRAALKPLEREWGAIDGNRRQKWLEIAGRMPRMSADDQARVQARMIEWAAMTPQQRAQVRLLFQEAKQVAPQNRKESWDAYQALPSDERQRLAARAAAETAAAASGAASDAARRGARGDRTAQAKSNIVATPAPAPAPRAVAPTVVQAQPGATTTLMSRRAAPPSHQQVGLPKIAATPDFVDGVTLLPQRGAQAAAVRAPVAVEPTVRR